MGIAGEVVELFELAENGERRIGTEYALEFGQVSDFVAAQVLAEGGRVKSAGRIML